MEEQIKGLENNIATISKELVELKELIASSFKKVDSNFTIVTGKLLVLERKVGELTYKIDNLDGSTSKGFNDVGGKIETLTEEIQKISVVTKYDEMFKNQKGLN
jgi:predicted  nucleic acid-binding Zn-ribbon protein